MKVFVVEEICWTGEPGGIMAIFSTSEKAVEYRDKLTEKVKGVYSATYEIDEHEVDVVD